MDTPSPNSNGHFEIKSKFESDQGSPLIQAIKDLAENFREGFFGKKKEAVKPDPQPIQNKYKVLDNQKISDLRIFCGIKAGEFLDIEDVIAIHSTLKSLADKEGEIEEFISFDTSVVKKINEAHEENEKDNLVLPLKQEIDRLITIFVGRYLSKKEGQSRSTSQHEVKVRTKTRAAIRSLSDIRLDEEEANEADANVISIQKAKSAHGQTPAEQPEDDEPEPFEPKTNVA